MSLWHKGNPPCRQPPTHMYSPPWTLGNVDKGVDCYVDVNWRISDLRALFLSLSLWQLLSNASSTFGFVLHHRRWGGGFSV